MWIYDSVLDNNGFFQFNYFVLFFVYLEKERIGNVCGNCEMWKFEIFFKIEKVKEKECLLMSKWIVENNVQLVFFYGKKKINEINIVEGV